MKMMEEKEILYKPIGAVNAMIFCYIVTPLLLINVFLKYPLLSTSIWGLILVFGTYMVIRKRKKVIIINPRGILFHRIVGWKEKDQSRLFVEWKEVKDIRFCVTSFGLDLKIYHKKKDVF